MATTSGKTGIVTAAPHATVRVVTSGRHGSFVFDGFEQVKDENARKRWFASAGTSLVIYAVIGVGLLFLARQAVGKATEEPELDVTFQSSPEPEEMKKEAPPPPPPKAAAPKVKRPGRAAPVQPTVIPEGRPSEAEPTGPRDGSDEPEEFGDGGELGGMETKIVAPPPPPPPPPVIERHEKTPDPVDEIDTAFVRAVPSKSNVVPTYPEAMRHKGVEATVRLKVRISDQGDVVDVKVIEGEEPFVAAAIAAVQTWHYRPATDDGRAVASTRLVQIPFRLPTKS
jgi:protein TonB